MVRKINNLEDVHCVRDAGLVVRLARPAVILGFGIRPAARIGCCEPATADSCKIGAGGRKEQPLRFENHFVEIGCCPDLDLLGRFEV